VDLDGVRSARAGSVMVEVDMGSASSMGPDAGTVMARSAAAGGPLRGGGHRLEPGRCRAFSPSASVGCSSPWRTRGPVRPGRDRPVSASRALRLPARAAELSGQDRALAGLGVLERGVRRPSGTNVEHSQRSRAQWNLCQDRANPADVVHPLGPSSSKIARFLGRREVSTLLGQGFKPSVKIVAPAGSA
jgi:hypothetical protein